MAAEVGRQQRKVSVGAVDRAGLPELRRDAADLQRRRQHWTEADLERLEDYEIEATTAPERSGTGSGASRTVRILKLELPYSNTLLFEGG
jgi:hypothetical protein